MTIKDLMPILPKYHDNSGFDVVVTIGNWRNIYKTFSQLSEEDLNREVLAIEQGKALVNGDFTEELHLLVKE